MSKYDLVYEIKGLVPRTVVIALEEELSITEDIDSEVDKAAARFGYYAVLAEKAGARFEKLKLSFNFWEADSKCRKDERLAFDTEKKLTEGQMKSYIMSQPKYKTYQLKMIELREQSNIMKVIARAFEKKSDLVQTKAANRRKEAGRSK